MRRRDTLLARWGMLLALTACMPSLVRQGAGREGWDEALAQHPAAFWNSATVYFVVTDRFANGNPANDRSLGRKGDGARLRSFEGGDFAGIRQKLEEGYFDRLGVTAIWLTPFVEQIHGQVDEGTGMTYGYHGYWAKDWTVTDPAFGSMEELRALVDAAHRRRIRVLMDAVINHPGPVTPVDPAWPAEWVRTTPPCRFRDYASTVSCALVPTLPDFRTERNEPVDLPQVLIEKWRREGRLDQEVAELDAFFKRTGYPRAPRYYVIKWLTDWVREFGFDGYRMDTAKHFEEGVSLEVRREAERAFSDWKQANPSKVLDALPFFMVAEAYGYEVGMGRAFSFGDRTVDFYAHGYDALINFAFKQGPVADVFAGTAAAINTPTGALSGAAVLNYVSSHDDGGPYDLDRRDPFGAGTRLLLSPGGAQIYYGDEVARPLKVDGAVGDANLRSVMDWRATTSGGTAGLVLEHWQKLGQFRRAHPAIGAGTHQVVQQSPYVFGRRFEKDGLRDQVVVAIGLPTGSKTIPVGDVFGDGVELRDAYSGVTGVVRSAQVLIDTPFQVVLLESASPGVR